MSGPPSSSALGQLHCDHRGDHNHRDDTKTWQSRLERSPHAADHKMHFCCKQTWKAAVGNTAHNPEPSKPLPRVKQVNAAVADQGVVAKPYQTILADTTAVAVADISFRIVTNPNPAFFSADSTACDATRTRLRVSYWSGAGPHLHHIGENGADSYSSLMPVMSVAGMFPLLASAIMLPAAAGLSPNFSM